MMRSCPSCHRLFTRKSYAIHLRYLAVKAELSGGPPAEHLGPMSEPVIPKQQRHRMDSVEHKAGMK